VARTLKYLSLTMGLVCVAIGLFHFALGIDSVPGEGSAGATVDSRERFYGAIFFGYGLAWQWAARQRPIPATVVRWLTGIFLLGGLGRLVSMVAHGQPHWFQVGLMVLELVLPAVFLWLAPADERADRAARPAAAGLLVDPQASRA